jgi:hypothetical protein
LVHLVEIRLQRRILRSLFFNRLRSLIALVLDLCLASLLLDGEPEPDDG